MTTEIPQAFLDAVALAHASWQPVLKAGLAAVAAADPLYLPALAADDYLPTRGRMFAAYALPLDKVAYVLVGEGPYPREQSATGFCFMDGAVDKLWSQGGLAKPVNRATSLRNFMKMLLVVAGELLPGETGGAAMVQVAEAANQSDSRFIQTLPELQQALTAQGFLLLNATPVFRAHVPPLKEARAWIPFLETVLEALSSHAGRNKAACPTLVLWGKVAGVISQLPANSVFPKAISEHPYNLSFIDNAGMQSLFGPMQLLIKK
ncbi:MAG: uracil-DNA glycosylase [Janthinobacterium lividum]